LSPTEWRRITAKLRRARLLAQEDPHNPGYIDTHPLVREYFGEQLRSQQRGAWKEWNKRLFYYYQANAPQLPDSFRHMEPLFLSVICACNAGLFRKALHEVYIPRIQRGNALFAGNVLGARGALLSVLAHFFQRRRWDSPVVVGSRGQSLSTDDRLFILMQAGLYLTHTRGLSAVDARICYERTESLCYSLNRPLLLYLVLQGQWRYSFTTDKLTATMQIATRVHSLAQEQNDSALMIGAYQALAATHYDLGNFEPARQYAMCGVQIWPSGGVRAHPKEGTEEITAIGVVCLCYEALSEWHMGEIAPCQAAMATAISLAKELKDLYAVAVALYLAGILNHCQRNSLETQRLVSELIALSTRQNFAFWLAGASILRGWVRAASGAADEGVSWIAEGIRSYRATGSILGVPFFLALKAEALHLADRTSEALEAISESQALVERFEDRHWCAELHRLRGVFLAATDAEDTQIVASFHEAIRIAKEQKSISLEERAEATYAEYCSQKANLSGGSGIRLAL
jgi:tetratricopeptide (TPR) repeat protein